MKGLQNMKKLYITAGIAGTVAIVTNPIVVDGINTLLTQASEYSDYTMLVGTAIIIGCFYFANRQPVKIPKKKK